MKRNLFISIKYLLLSLLVVVFFTTLIVSYITYKNPTQIISFIQQFIPEKQPMKIPIKGIGIIGDSQSDEYRADDNRGSSYPNTTLNWVEILAEKRNLNFGAYSSWDEPRRTGYEYNWARSGATSYSMIMSAQHIGVAEQVKQGKVNVVIIFIGANDFSPYSSEAGYQAIYSGSATDAQITQKVNDIAANVETAVDVIQDAGNPLVFIVKIPDWNNHLGIQTAFPFPTQRFRVSNVINSANSKLEKIAKEHNAITIDPNAFFNELPREKQGNKIIVDTVKLEWFLLNDDPHNFVLSDGVHTGTVINGLFANVIIEKLNEYTSATIKPFSTKDVLKIAGL